MEHTRDWRAKTEEISAHEGALDIYNDDDKTKYGSIVGPQFKDEVEEAEVVAPLTLAPDGGWGWVVLFCSFVGLSITDGLMYSYGPMLRGIIEDLNISESRAALINSVLISTVNLISPVSSALINRFGFRYIGMCGSIVCSLAWFAAYFTRDFTSLLILYGFTAGVGFSLVSLSVNLVAGFYFDKLRTIALGVVSCGSSVGIMTFYPINVYLVLAGGWRNALLLHSGVSGFIYFLCLTFRPLPTIKITAEDGRRDSARPYAYLPNMSTKIEEKSLAPSITEKAMGTASNAYYPYATELMDAMSVVEEEQPGPSAAPTPLARVVVTNSVDPLQMDEIRMQINTPDRPDVIFQKQKKTKKQSNCWRNCCDWEESSDARPIYRDDVFYNASKKVLMEHRRSLESEKRTSIRSLPRRSLELTRAEQAAPAADSASDDTSGLKYQLGVMRVATTTDLEERKILCPTAVRRALATVLDLSLMKKSSFQLFCLTGFFFNLGVLVPYVYLESRGIAKGLDPLSSAMFVSVVSLANLVGRLCLIFIATKVSAVNVYGVTLVVTGLATMLSSVSYNLVFQMAYCVVFGFFVAGASCLRAVVIVELYGLQNLTGGTGIALMFHGLAIIISTPMAGALISYIGFEVAFSVSGMFITLAGIVVVLLKAKVYLENRALENPIKRSIIVLKEKNDT